jgi:DNA polymerase-3 subunit gamma/tau
MQLTTNMDILEIDAASNNSVEEIRTLRESVQFLPSCGKYKVYIIDEVHMLSNSAFNALLKTLEEPPSHVIFILATTEVYKLPTTVLSRCMRFDFRLVDKSDLTQLLIKVFDQEGQQADNQALEYIAMRAEGSVRDCLSIADSCISNSVLTMEAVLQLLGATDISHIIDFIGVLHYGNVPNALSMVQVLSTQGASWLQVCKDVCKCARDILIVKNSVESNLQYSADIIQRLNNTQFGNEFLVSVVHNFLQVESELRYSVSPRIVFESVALMMCLRSGPDMASLQDRINRLEEFVKANGITLPNTQTNNIVSTTDSVPQMSVQASTIPKQVQQKTRIRVEPTDAMSVWGKIVTWMRKNSTPSHFRLVANQTSVVIQDKILILRIQDSKFKEFEDIQDIIKSALHQLQLDLDFRFVKAPSIDSKDAEISRIRGLVGDTPTNVSK